MCKPSCCNNNTGPGLGTAIALAAVAVVAIAALRVIETILWGLIIAAGVTVATVAVAAIAMAWHYRRSAVIARPVPSPITLRVQEPLPPARRAVTGRPVHPADTLGQAQAPRSSAPTGGDRDG
jgi:hypothetical protein